MSEDTTQYAPTSHHPMGCSKWNALYHCGVYESAGSSEASERGTEIHRLIAERLHGRNPAVPADMIDEVDRAVELAQAAHRILAIEKQARFFEYYHSEYDYFTTIDLAIQKIDGSHALIDWKTGDEYDYRCQMAGMALAWMQEHFLREISCLVIYTKLRKTVEYKFTWEEAYVIYLKVKANFENKERKACEYCQFCKHLADCPQVTDRVTAIANKQEDWQLEHYNPAQLTDPSQMSKAYKLSKLIAKWADAVQAHIKTQMVAGASVDGLQLATRSAPVEIADLQGLYEALQADLTVEEYLQCCKVTVGKLEEAIQAKKDITAKDAKNFVRTAIKPFSIEKEPTIIIKEVK